MHVLIGYGDALGTTGQYLEDALSAAHEVTFVGRGSAERPGYAANLDVTAFVANMTDAPDLFLYVDSGNNPYAPVGLHTLPIPTIGYFMDAYPPGSPQRTPYLETLAPLFDYLFIAHRTALPHFQALRSSAAVHWLPPCCDPAVHGDQHRQREYDIGFVGQVNNSYPERVQLLEALEQRYRINDYRRHYYRQEMARIYSQSKIVVNISHSDQIIPMRFFEAPAAGAMLLTQQSHVNGQSELLREGEEYVSFTNVDDALNKVDYYLAHEPERQRIAHSGQTAVLARHTYGQRTAELLNIVRTDGLRCQAPARHWSQAEAGKNYMRAHSQLRLVDCVMEQTGISSTLQLTYALQALLRRIRHRH
jgi:hypothetical protein